MTLLAPWALYFLVVALAVVGLYLLKVRRDRVEVPSLDFWRQFIAQTQVRSLFQRLKRWLSLLLWLIIVACILLAMGNPIFSLGEIKPRSITVIIDNSASMQSIEDAELGTTRLDRARTELDRLLAGRPVLDTWMLIEAGGEPRVAQGWTRQKRAMADTAATIAPHLGAADLRAATALANQLLADKEEPTIVLLSDGGAGAATELAKEDEHIVYWPIGSRSDNVGITRLQGRLHRRLANQSVFVRLHNAGETDREVEVVFAVDGATVAVEPALVPAAGVWEKTITLDVPEGGVLRASIDANDALAIDNEAFAVLDPISSAAVLLVTPPEDAYFFEQALLAMESLVDASASHTVGIDAFDAGLAAAAKADLVIFNNCVPETLPETGRFIFVNSLPKALPVREIGMLQSPMLRLANHQHPLTEHLTFGMATLATAHEVDLVGPATVLATSSAETPLIFLVQEPDRESLCLAFDVLASDLPFRNAFPMLLRNAVTHLVSERPRWIESQYPIGAIISPLRPMPESIEQVRVAQPNDEKIDERTLDVRGGTFSFADTQKAAPLRFTIGEEDAYTAVNLADDRETRIAPIASARPVEECLVLSSQWLGWPPWMILAAAALLLVGLEWLTYHYRWTE